MFELTVKSDDLARELAPALRLTERKQTIPHLSYTKLDATPTGVRLAATDLDVAYSGGLPVVEAGTGAVLVPTKRLYDIARALAGAELRLSVNGSTVALKGPAFSARFNVLPHEEFPAVPVGEDDPVTIQRATLITLLERAMVATSERAFHGGYQLGGVHLTVGGGTITASASDGHRLSVVSAPCDAAAPPDTATLHYKGARAVLELARESDATDVIYTRDERHRFFAMGECQILTRLLDTAYPNFVKLVPSEHTVAIECDTLAWLAALKRVRALSDDASSRVTVQVMDGGLTLGMRSQAGEATATVAAEYAGRAHETAFNVGYVTDYLSTVACDRVRFEQQSTKLPGVFKAIGGETTSVYIVMPMGMA